jgi:hypothetical protein
VANTAIETPVVISGGLYLKDVLVGYPTLGETNNQVTTRAVLFTTDANSNTLTEFGLFNKDATPKMFSHTVYTGIAKTTSIQVIYVEKDSIT